MKIAGSYIAIIFTLLLSGCHTLTAPVSTVQSTVKPYTESTALTIYEAHPLKGSERVSVHAYSYTRGSDHCSRTIALNFSSSLAYTQTMVLYVIEPWSLVQMLYPSQTGRSTQG